MLVKYHWIPTQGVRSMTDADRELRVRMTAGGEHPELDFDPLDDTRTWPENDFLALPVGRIVLARNPASPERYRAGPESLSCRWTGRRNARVATDPLGIQPADVEHLEPLQGR